MFTGIVEEVGSVRALQKNGRVATLAIAASSTVEGVGVGGSIAVNGVCLTVVERKPDGFVFEVGPETLSRTALSVLGPGDAVNLERPLRFGGALGGHLVLGHVDGVGTVDAVTRVESTARVRITLPSRDLEPLRVVLDTAARTPREARLIRAGIPERALIVVGADAAEERTSALAAAGASVVRCRTIDGRVSLESLLAELFAREVRAVLVEGGGEIHASFLDAGLVDRVAVYVAPLLVGGRQATPVVGGGGRELKSAVKLGSMTTTSVGDDLLIEADVVREGRSG